MRWLKMWCDHLVSHNRDVSTDAVVNEVLSIVYEQMEKKEAEKPKVVEKEQKYTVSTLTGKYG